MAASPKLLVVPPADPGEEWKIQAVCRTYGDPDVWWPTHPLDAWLGVALCHTCPVREQCLSYALTHHEHGGTWGATSQWDRAELLGHPASRRRRARSA